MLSFVAIFIIKLEGERKRKKEKDTGDTLKL
jgi:hypothetical protein